MIHWYLDFKWEGMILKTLFNIVEDQIKKLMNSDVDVV